MTVQTNTRNESRLTTMPQEGPVVDVIIPVFNEESTVLVVIEKVLNCGVPSNVIVVNDGSTDGTADRLATLEQRPNITIISRNARGGKGAAIRTALGLLKSDAVMIQDADLEYDPNDIPALVSMIQSGTADAVFGNRFGRENKFLSTRQILGNRLISAFFRICSGRKISDVETCYKVIRRDLFERFSGSLTENGFAIEIEISSKLSRIPGIRIAEVPIRYSARSTRQGKKIRAIDGIHAFAAILRYSFSDRHM